MKNKTLKSIVLGLVLTAYTGIGVANDSNKEKIQEPTVSTKVEQKSEIEKLKETINSDPDFTKVITLDVSFKDNVFNLTKIQIFYQLMAINERERYKDRDFLLSNETPGMSGQALYHEILSRDGDLLREIMLSDPRIKMATGYPVPVSIRYIDSGTFYENLSLIRGMSKINIYGAPFVNDETSFYNFRRERGLRSYSHDLRQYKEQNTELLFSVDLEEHIKKFFSKEDGICDPDYEEIDVDCKNE